jgi:hypothetical protein
METKSKSKVMTPMKKYVPKEIKSCVCHVHLKNEETKSSKTPCTGHGKNCPCTKQLHIKELETKILATT